MSRSRKLFIATLVMGLLSFASFIFERLALTDIFHDEPDLRLEWMVVHGALIPITLFHVLGIIAAIAGLTGRRPSATE